jgi:adenylate cyclase
MVGYTRLMAADERGTLAGLEDARLVFRSCIEAHAGRVIDMAGDSVLATFDTATGALRAALAAQARLRADAAPLAANRRVQFRVGVHVGDIIEKTDGTVYGDGVNIAARLQALADPAEVWVSDSARGAIGSRVAASYQVCGRHRVKDAARTVIAYRAVEAPSGAAGGLVAS